MKNLFATASYTFNNFYANLNTQGQIIFSTILFLIGILCVLLFISYIVESVKYKIRIKKLRCRPDYKKEVYEVKKEKNTFKLDNIEELKEDDNKTEISNIAKRVEDALSVERPINLTNFEEDQEKTAIISIDELMARAKDLEIIDDDSTGINYLEKYNLQPAEVEEVVNNTINKDSENKVKAFKVSQVISPIYGIKKEVVNKNE